MNRSAKLGVGVLLVVGAGTCFVLCRPKAQAASAPKPAQDSAEVLALRAQVAELRGEVQSSLVGMHSEVEALRDGATQFSQAVAVASAAVQSTEQPPAERAPRLDSEARLQWEKERHAMIADLAAKFSREPRDRNWSSTVEATIREAATQSPALSSAVRGVDCRSKSCRVEVVDDQASNLSENLKYLIRGCGRTLPNVVADHIKATDAADGKAAYVLYMSSGDA